MLLQEQQEVTGQPSGQSIPSLSASVAAFVMAASSTSSRTD
jgi:hypothetical protein